MFLPSKNHLYGDVLLCYFARRDFDMRRIDTKICSSSVSDEAITYVANSLNQYTAVNGTQPIYDDDGNLLSDGRFEYAWDGENRLIGITTREDLQPSAQRVKVTHCYDHQSRRIAIEHAVWNGTAWQPSEFRNFIYDGWNEVVEVITTPQSTTTNLYVWGLDLSSTPHDAAGVGGLLAASFENTTALYTYDANGNVSQLINLDGSLLAHYEYDPFGKTIVSDGVPRQSANSATAGLLAQTNPFRFSTKHWNDATGLGYWGYRLDIYYSVCLLGNQIGELLCAGTQSTAWVTFTCIVYSRLGVNAVTGRIAIRSATSKSINLR